MIYYLVNQLPYYLSTEVLLVSWSISLKRGAGPPFSIPFRLLYWLRLWKSISLVQNWLCNRLGLYTSGQKLIYAELTKYIKVKEKKA